MRDPLGEGKSRGGKGEGRSTATRKGEWPVVHRWELGGSAVVVEDLDQVRTTKD